MRRRHRHHRRHRRVPAGPRFGPAHRVRQAGSNLAARRAGELWTDGSADERSRRTEAGERGAARAHLHAFSAAILRISASLDLDTVLREVVDSARALTGARYGMIATVDDAGAIQEFIAPGLSADERRHMAEWPHGYQFFEHLQTLPGALRLADMPAYIRSLGYSEELTLSKTLQAMPMQHRGVHVGNFFLGEKEGGQEFTEEDGEVLVLFASQAATAIANARTHRDEQRARADLEALVDTSPVGVVVFDAQRPAVRCRSTARRGGSSGGCAVGTAQPEQLLEVMICRRGDGRETRLDELPLADEFRNAETVRAEEIELSVPDGRSVDRAGQRDADPFGGRQRQRMARRRRRRRAQRFRRAPAAELAEARDRLVRLPRAPPDPLPILRRAVDAALLRESHRALPITPERSLRQASDRPARAPRSSPPRSPP